jgi:hypothetical protein
MDNFTKWINAIAWGGYPYREWKSDRARYG